MATIEKSILIKASSEAVDAYALNPSTWPRWFEGVQSVEPDETYPEVGGIVRTAYKSMGTTFHVTMTSEELARGSHQTFSMDGMITGTQHWSYQPEGGGIRVTCVFEYELPGGGLGKIADKVLFQRTNSASIEKSLQNLKELVEA